MDGLIILGFLAAFTILVLAKSAVVVPNTMVYVVERLGKFHATLSAGFHLLLPFLDRVAYRRSLKEEVMDVPEQACITKDNVAVRVDGLIYLQVVDASKSSYGITDYRQAVVQLAQTALRSAIGKIELDKTFEERDKINVEVVTALNEAANPWGVKLMRYEIRDIVPPESVKNAMEQQMQAERQKRAAIALSEGEKQAAINRSEGEKQAAVNKAQGRKIQMELESMGQQAKLVNEASGEAEGILLRAEATAKALARIGETLAAEGGMSAASLRVAEQFAVGFQNLARQGTTILLPANLSDLGTLVAGAMGIVRASAGAAPGQGSCPASPRSQGQDPGTASGGLDFRLEEGA